jgi:hypothetical protein
VGWFTGSSTGIFALAAIVLTVFLLLVELSTRLVHKSFLGTVILGTDNRTSTSKTFVLMWTLLIAWALLALLIAGEFLEQQDCVVKRMCSTDGIGQLQLGWMQFLASGLDPAYLVLLGIPAAAAVGAKAITQSKVDSGATPVVPTTPADTAISARVAQIFSADDGSTDIGDLQYVIFNLLTAGYFVAEVVRLTGVGLPHLPETLLGLTGVSAALYVGKKAATRTQPTITSVFPSYLNGGQTITIIGTDLTRDPTVPPNQQPPGLRNPEVTVNGVPATQVRADANVPDRLTATVPNGLNLKPDPISGTVEVLSAYGFKTPPYSVTIK